ncbi:GroS Co-chaperonin GroES (HSP10) [uncultured Caudovirales phage]|uniref:GroS Co-chaperonin GroES (HSP10) n=1 Tax=uncultured Caudovirales phage TaxID=2100421 RepID=A0A6J5T939_9CAUD|nr:GroS Co-chaperonin GroES (HSP10) [uncultured Caudovirales phage]
MIHKESGISPVGTSVLLLPEQVATKTQTGIILATDSMIDRLNMAATDGVVAAMSPDAFADLGEKAPRCQVGDKVKFVKYAGVTCVGNDGLTYRLIHDNEILATIVKKEETE